jgi:ribonuclease-3
MAVCDPLLPAVPRRRLSAAAATPTPAPTDATEAPTEDIERLLGHSFARPELLAEALTHPSASALPHRSATKGHRRNRAASPRAAGRGYERLEFLGDRVLGLVISDLLWRRFMTEPEGDLTRRLTHLVRRDPLARVAASIGLDRFLRLSPSEMAAGAARNPGILADACEAVIAAIYLDGGFAAAFAFIERFWEPLIAEMDGPPSDPKTTLQEWAQGRGLPLPDYQLTATSGPDHALRFTVAARVSGFEEATATASSKRAAETAAAAALLERLTVPTPPHGESNAAQE